MTILRNAYVVLSLGVALIAALALAGGLLSGPGMAARFEAAAERAIAEAGGAPVTADFSGPYGWATRHPALSGGETLDEGTRDRVAKAVAAIPGVGGIRWTDGNALAESASVVAEPLDCEEDVDALLRARSIRFEEGSARI